MELYEKIGKTVQEHYQTARRFLSFGEYLELVRQSPEVHLRSSAQYIRDMLDFYGSRMVRHPEGEIRRYNLFDAPWEEGYLRLVGQEEVQNAIYRIIKNFVRQGRVDRFILLHGPNGSSKSTITELIARGMEHYSAQDAGTLYHFNWVFPTRGETRSGIGFGSQSRLDTGESYAHLEETEVDARLPCEMHDHPLLLIPQQVRTELLQEILQQASARGEKELRLAEYFLKGDLCHKCKLIFESLLGSYEGDYLRLLRHVQVERFYVSRRYREAATRVEPQLAVDARSRQVTADRSLASLPTALQNINLFELEGDLVQANRGIIDYSDLLKRPLEAYKYLLTTVEEGRVVLDRANLYFDMVFIGSSNEGHLNAFMESPEWTSFKGRMELVRVPYVLQYPEEREIYDEQITEAQVGAHIAPHATGVAALWAVLSRLHRPVVERYPKEVKEVVTKLTPMEKADLYASGKIPEWVRGETAKAIRAQVGRIWNETDTEVVYEGRTGASPREVKTAILNAAQNPRYGCLSPEAVLQELRALVQETSIYAFLRMDPQQGYYDHKGFIDVAHTWYLDRVDGDLWSATGLVDEASYGELLSRYITHVTHFVRKEKIRNPVTEASEEPDQRLMAEVEKELGVKGEPKEYRQGLMTKIGAWSVDHTGQRPDYVQIFPEQLAHLRSSYFQQQRKWLTRMLRNALRVLTEDTSGMPEEEVARARGVVERLKQEHGYCDHCAREAISALVRERYAD